MKYFTYILLSSIFLIAASTSNAQTLKPDSSGYAKANGIKVYYEVYGEGDPVVLLHGAYYTIGLNWGQIIPELAKKRKVIALEMQGHGHTPFSFRNMTLDILASDVEKVWDHLKMDSADVVGCSCGGQIAYKLAIQSPRRLRRLVIIASVHKSAGWLPEVNAVLKALKPEYFVGSPLQVAYDSVA